MLVSVWVTILVATSRALTLGRREAGEKLYTIEFAPGETKLVSEAEKWALKSEGKNFFDVTDFGGFEPAALQRRATVSYPKAVGQTSAVKALLPNLSKSTMQTTLQTFSEFQNRYYKSSYGKQSSTWLLGQVQAIIDASGAKNVTAAAFNHTWGQNSIIATIPGKSDKTIVIGAHQDSINLSNPSSGRAPGADDDGSGTVTILDAFRALLADAQITSRQAENTLEFHWYSAEEAGLLGSQAIFQQYAKQNRDVKAMLQQDMTGYTQGTISNGHKLSVGVITDYVDAGLTNFVKLVITAYCSIPYIETKCGYACSDHASASKAGYPSAFVIESAFDDTSPYIHGTRDTMSTVDFDHVLEHAKMTTGFAYELAFAPL